MFPKQNVSHMLLLSIPVRNRTVIGQSVKVFFFFLDSLTFFIHIHFGLAEFVSTFQVNTNRKL